MLAEMVTAKTVMAALALMFLPVFSVETLAKRGLESAVLVVVLVMLAAAGFNLCAGYHLLSTWTDPTLTADPETLEAASGRRRGGLVLFVIKYWPYLLIAASFFWASQCVRMLWGMRP